MDPSLRRRPRRVSARCLVAFVAVGLDSYIRVVRGPGSIARAASAACRPRVRRDPPRRTVVEDGPRRESPRDQRGLSRLTHRGSAPIGPRLHASRRLPNQPAPRTTAARITPETARTTLVAVAPVVPRRHAARIAPIDPNLMPDRLRSRPRSIEHVDSFKKT